MVNLQTETMTVKNNAGMKVMPAIPDEGILTEIIDRTLESRDEKIW